MDHVSLRWDRGHGKGDPQHQEDGRPWAEKGWTGKSDNAVPLAQGEHHRHGVLHEAHAVWRFQANLEMTWAFMNPDAPRGKSPWRPGNGAWV